MERTPPARTPFDWLRDRDHRRSALRQVESALARGWFDPATADVSALTATLAELAEDPATTASQGHRMLRLLALLEQSSARTPATIEAPAREARHRGRLS
jgi:hypothetical protein